MKHTQSWTILIYSLVLVLLWFFLASATLSLSQRLQFDFDIRKNETILYDFIKTKSLHILNYWRFLNSDGLAFQDTIGCPTNITFSGTTLRTTNVSTNLRYQDNVFFCEGLHAWNPVSIFFNSSWTDTETLRYQGSEVFFNSSNQNPILWDSDNTQVNASSSFPLQPDWIDDNFNSDNYMISSSWSLLYPDGYIDNDVEHRLSQYWYIKPWSWWYNIYWINDKVRNYISENTNNIGPFVTIGSATQWYIYLESNASFDIRIVRLDKDAYNDFNELRIIESWESTSEISASQWFIQSDFTLAESPVFASDWVTVIARNPAWNEFNFDFSNNDYAIFLRNRDPNNILLYKNRVISFDGSQVYFVPVQDHNLNISSVLWNHIIFWDNWIPIGQNIEFTQIK